MKLGPGTTLAHYEIYSLLGKGGMGEVWRARDTKLGRDVAIKVLPDEFALDGERLARFEREARVLASLDHGNVASIFGIEECDDGRVLVMQLAEGDDLSVRLERGAIPVEEAVAITTQIAEALEAAHEKGIVHRDLKPANVKVDEGGHVRVLDFGLAKAFEVEEGDSDITNSPTMVRAATHAGVILGTAAYMSPEQARGKRVDRRADIWSFGVVLWEMLTGQRMFLGDTVSDTLAAVLTKEPDFGAVPPDTPEHVCWLLRRCLVRDAKVRLRDIGEARAILKNPEIFHGATTQLQPTTEKGAGPWMWIAALLAVVSIALVAVFLVRSEPLPEATYVNVSLPPDTHLALSGIQPGPPAVSPDGTRIAFVAEEEDGVRHLWVRALGEGKAKKIPETEGASYPFWSWDGGDLGFFAQQKLRRVPADGGAVLTITDAPSGKGGTWNRDGVILFCPSFNASLYKVLATGGQAEVVTKLDAQRGDSSHRFPQFMDDGTHFTYLVRSRNDADNVVLFSALDADASTEVFKTESNALVVGDRILYLRERTLVTQRFDQSSGVATGPPIPLAERIKVIIGAARMVVAAGPGVIVMQSGELSEMSQLTWVDREGNRIGTFGTPGDFDSPTLSPDGSRVAVEMGSANFGTSDIWLMDITTGNRERLTFETANEINPVWSPDGRMVAYASNENGPYEIMVKDVDAASEPRTIVPNESREVRPWAGSWPEQNLIVYVTEELTKGTTTIWAKDLSDDGPARRIVDSTYRAPRPDVSSDGRWMVYGSGGDNASPSIVVVDFPEAKRRWEVARGSNGFWSVDGSELFFFDPDGALNAVEVRSREGNFAWGPPHAMFRWTDLLVVPDSDRFLVADSLSVNDVSTVTFDAILGWEALVGESD